MSRSLKDVKDVKKVSIIYQIITENVTQTACLLPGQSAQSNQVKSNQTQTSFIK